MDEDMMISKLMSYSETEIFQKFKYSIDNESSVYTFIEKQNEKHYMTVNKSKTSFIALVNADFGFSRPLGSNNCKELLNIGRKFVKAFNLEVNW